MAAFAVSPLSLRSKVFVLETNLALLEYIRCTLGDHYALELFSETDSILRELEQTRPDLILIAWDGISESITNLTQVMGAAHGAPVVLLSCTASVEELAPVIRLGAQGFLLKPFEGRDLMEAVEKYLTQAPVKEEHTVDDHKEIAIGEAHSFVRTSKKEPPVDDHKEIAIGEGRYFVRASKNMRDVENQAALVAQSDISVLILGESGTGKEVIAMYLHNASARRHKTFLKINCA